MTSNSILNKENVVAVLFVFILANTSFMLHYFASIPNIGWYDIVNKSLYYFGFFGYIFVIGILLLYYISKANNWLKSDKKRVLISMGVILGLGYASFDSLSVGSWLIFIRDMFMVGLIMVGWPFVEKLASKIPNIEKKDKEKS